MPARPVVAVNDHLSGVFPLQVGVEIHPSAHDPADVDEEADPGLAAHVERTVEDDAVLVVPAAKVVAHGRGVRLAVGIGIGIVLLPPQPRPGDVMPGPVVGGQGRVAKVAWRIGGVAVVNVPEIAEVNTAHAPALRHVHHVVATHREGLPPTGFELLAHHHEGAGGTAQFPCPVPVGLDRGFVVVAAAVAVEVEVDRPFLEPVLIGVADAVAVVILPLDTRDGCRRRHPGRRPRRQRPHGRQERSQERDQAGERPHRFMPPVLQRALRQAVVREGQAPSGSTSSAMHPRPCGGWEVGLAGGWYGYTPTSAATSSPWHRMRGMRCRGRAGRQTPLASRPQSLDRA
ncbi:MAG: hypothetical protein BWZ02_02281 [Lentisphaerae bacterium ADurb.BinA184]|nr:MAG: hypothetical protein BWZ02_02281 [Lentisphaerae bacterium ADurb.BinA184]